MRLALRISNTEAMIARRKEYQSDLLDENDQHGVMDASADIREFEAKLEVLREWLVAEESADASLVESARTIEQLRIALDTIAGTLRLNGTVAPPDVVSAVRELVAANTQLRAKLSTYEYSPSPAEGM